MSKTQLWLEGSKSMKKRTECGEKLTFIPKWTNHSLPKLLHFGRALQGGAEDKPLNSEIFPEDSGEDLRVVNIAQT